jgi:hypothetical protein
MKHTCHVPHCATACPPKYLTCPAHWKMVPKEMQDEVYRTVGMRGKLIDETWAPWWRAQANAIHAIMVAEGRDKERCDNWLVHEFAVADRMETR